MFKPSRRLLAAVFHALIAPWVLVSAAIGASGDIPSWQPPKTGIGYEVDLDRQPEERPAAIRASEVRDRAVQPLYARILFSWDSIETERGIFRFEEVEKTVSEYREAGFDVVLAPRGGNRLYGPSALPSPEQAEYLAAWRTFLRKTAERFRQDVRFYQVADGADVPGALPDGAAAREIAFLMKNGAVEIRGADPAALLVLGSVSVSRVDLLEAILREDLGPYLDAVALRGEKGVDPAPLLERASEILLRTVPAASLWLVGQPLPENPAASFSQTRPVLEDRSVTAGAPEPVPGEGDAGTAGAVVEKDPDARLRSGALIRTYAAALAAGSRLTLFDLPKGPGGPPELSSLTVLLRRLFLPTTGPSPEGPTKTRFLSEGGEPLGVEAWKFFDASTFQAILVYAAKDPSLSLPRIQIVLDTADVTGAVVDDLLSVTEKPPEAIKSDPASNSTKVAAPVSAFPLLLRYQRFASPGFTRKPEAVQVGGKKEIAAEEIIARHQEFQADQDRLLQSLIASGKISYHYKVAEADVTVDVTTMNNFYWDRKVGAEWEQKEFYFNGVRWKGKKPPELPLIQPEKVVILPLDINLNKDYAYRYLGTEKAEGRECYVLEFAPVVQARTLYQGKVWIDRKSFAKVRVASVQTGLAPPVVSNDERDTYGPAPGPGNEPIWVLQRIDGQQIFATAGVNLVVLREVEFSDFVLNAPDFQERRQSAYGTDHTILRDTDKGFRYLDRTEAGERVVRDATTRSTTLGLAGVFYEKDLDFPVPLAGINRFDFNFRNTGTQTNLFFAGALLQASIQNPHLFGTRLDAGASAFGIAFSGTDNFYLGDRKLEEAAVRTRTQSLSVNVGYPLGNFFKVKTTGSLDYAQYGRADETETFRVPNDTTETSLRAEGQFNRWGYTVQAGVTHSRRGEWKPWGDSTGDLTPPCDALLASEAVGTRLCDFDPDEQSYTRTRADVSKQIILPLFQKLTVRGTYLTGRNLDRFSKYRFNFFGTRLHGFSGSGVRFDHGAIAAATYSFNLAEVVRFDATLDHARVRDSQVRSLDPLASLGGYQDFTGFGLAGNFLGPWNTVLQFDYGIALRSDLPGLRGDQEIELLLLKFF